MRSLARLSLIVAAALIGVACGGSGSGTAPSTGAPAATTTNAVTPAPTTTAPSGAADPGTASPSEPPSLPAPASPAAFALTSGAFTAGGLIPKRFTCDGEDVSPALSWSGAPAAARAFVLIVDDPDAGGFVHWVAYNLAPASAGLAEDVGTGTGAPPQGANDFGKAGWGGPCPPSGEHRYRFTLSALASPLPLTGAPDAAATRAALAEATVLATATLEGRYSRP